MNTRPIASFGAAFLLTVSAALFAPRLLPLAAFPLAAATVMTRLRSRQVVALVAGCLAAVLCCGLFWLGGGDATATDKLPEEQSLRSRLCADALEYNPATATGITLGVVFGYKRAIPSTVRDDLNRSGMAHLMAVSGLHISIAVAGAATLARRLGLGRAIQFALMTAAALVFWLASGMSVSATRAVIMVLLGLGAELLGRRADGLTSLSLAAVLLVGLYPPLIADLSFQLSFLAVLGILLLAPPLTRKLGGLWQSLLGDRRPVPQGLFAIIATSLSAQLAVTPVIGWIFGAVPLLGVLTNLVAIPLVYPVLLFGLLGAAAMLLGLTSIASLLFAAANIFSQLLAWLAQLTASLPLCCFNTIFPVDFAAVGLIILALLLAICLPTSIRIRQSLTVGVAVLGCLMTYVSVSSSVGTISVATSTRTGSLVIASPHGTVVVDNADSDYWRQRDRDMLASLGQGDTPAKLVATYPYTSKQELSSSALFYGVGADDVHPSTNVKGYQQLADTPTVLIEGVTARYIAPYCTEIIIGSTKLMKFDAEYDTIVFNYCTELCATVNPACCSSMRNCLQTLDVCDTIVFNYCTELGGAVPDDAAILVDWAGNLIDRTGATTVLRRPDGTSYLRIPM